MTHTKLDLRSNSWNFNTQHRCHPKPSNFNTADVAAIPTGIVVFLLTASECQHVASHIVSRTSHKAFQIRPCTSCNFGSSEVNVLGQLLWPSKKCGLSFAMEAGSPSPPTSDDGEDKAVPSSCFDRKLAPVPLQEARLRDKITQEVEEKIKEQLGNLKSSMPVFATIRFLVVKAGYMMLSSSLETCSALNATVYEL